MGSGSTQIAPGDVSDLRRAPMRTAVRAEDGAMFRRVSRSWHEAGSDIEHTEDHYRQLIHGEVVAEEVHRRSPATRSYTQAQARSEAPSI